MSFTPMESDESLDCQCMADKTDSKAANGNNKPDELAGGDVPKDFIKQWQRLSLDEQKAFLQQMNLVEAGTVEVKSNDANNVNLVWKKKGPFALVAPEKTNTVMAVDKAKKQEQLEAVLEGIEFIHKRNLPKGLVLNQEKVQAPVTTRQAVEGCDKIAQVLGKGNSAGEITVFKDRKSGHSMALKTIMISQFNADEIRLWVHMGDKNLAPELYQFELVDNKLVFTMEIMTGKDLQDVIDGDMWSFQDPGLARDFSLCVLHDLLQIWEEMRSNQYIHGDLHAGNLRLEKSMAVKIFDFGRAKSLLTEQKPERLIKNDIIGIIRVFCALYSGYDFNNIFEAKKILEAKDLKQLDECMIRISEDNRRELYQIMNMLFDTVRGEAVPNRSTYGDMGAVCSHVQSLLNKDMKEIKKKAAVIIFPERFQNKGESEPVFQAECECVDAVDAGLDNIWDHPDMDEFVRNVSDADLKELEEFFNDWI